MKMDLKSCVCFLQKYVGTPKSPKGDFMHCIKFFTLSLVHRLIREHHKLIPSSKAYHPGIFMVMGLTEHQVFQSSLISNLTIKKPTLIIVGRRPNNSNMFLGASANQFQMAKLLRVNETEAEKLLWSKLSNKQLGVKFRRQHPLHDFIADFYCHSHRLVIEVDGGIHNTVENRAYDELRSETFTSFGIQVMRFTNNDVIDHTENVIKSIKDRLSSIPL